MSLKSRLFVCGSQSGPSVNRKPVATRSTSKSMSVSRKVAKTQRGTAMRKRKRRALFDHAVGDSGDTVFDQRGVEVDQEAEAESGEPQVGHQLLLVNGKD